MIRANWFTRRGTLVCLGAATILLGGPIVRGQPATVEIDINEVEKLAAKVATQPATAPAASGDKAKSDANKAAATTQPSGPKAGTVAADGTFTGYYQDTDLRVVLRQLSMLFRTNIVASKDVSGRVTATLYDVTFEEALDSVLKSSGFGYVKEGKFIYVYTAIEIAELLKATQKKQVRTFQLAYITAADAQTLIKPALSADAVIAVTPAPATGIAGSTTEAGDNSHATSGMLVVNDLPENLDRVAQIIKEIDVKPEQVLIESTILSATLTEDNDLGVNFNVLGNTDFTNQGTTDGLTFVDGANAGDLTAIPGREAYNLSTARTDFDAITGGITFGFVTDSVSVFLRALETVTDVTVLANPKLLVVNRQKGEVIVGNKDGYLTTVVNDGVTTQSVEFLETGTTLIVRPYIGRDGYIRMMIHPEDSDGNISVLGLPSETTTEVTSNVLVRDGRTIVIGGLFRESTDNTKSQVPIVGNIPLLGTLFRSTTDQSVRDEVIVLITPHIVKQDEAEDVGANMKDDAERYRAGARKGMQWWAADRLATSYMAWAREHLKHGRIDRARWDVEAALAIRPRLIEAVEMKENLTDKAYWADQARQSSAKYTIQRMLMFEMGKDFRKEVYPAKSRDPKLPTGKSGRPANKPSSRQGPTTRPSGKTGGDAKTSGKT